MKLTTPAKLYNELVSMLHSATISELQEIRAELKLDLDYIPSQVFLYETRKRLLQEVEGLICERVGYIGN